MSKMTFLFFPNKAKTSLKTSKTPIYVRVLYNDAKAEHRLNLELELRELLLWNPIIQRVELPDSLINNHLDNISMAFKQFLAMNEQNLPHYTAAQIRDIVLQLEQPGQISIMDYVNKYFLKSVKNNGELSSGTKTNYKKAINHLETFLRYNKTPNMTIREMNNAFTNDFRSYLLNDIPELNKKGMVQPSALGNVKKFRTIFNQAVNEEKITKNPFCFIKLSNRSPKKPRLNIHQVKEIYNADGKLSPTEIVYKDIFMFSVFTGLAYIDASTLKKEAIEYRANGEVKLTTPRKKTGEYAEMFLTQFALDIIDKYKNTPYILDTNGLIPRKTNKDINLQLKIIAAKTGVPFTVSSHTARHTFRQLLSESGIEDDGVIKRMMGQSRKDEVDNAYYEVTESRLMEAKNKFNNFLKTHLS